MIFSDAWFGSIDYDLIDTDNDLMDDSFRIIYDVDSNHSSEDVVVQLEVYNSLNMQIDELLDDFIVDGSQVDTRQLDFTSVYQDRYSFVVKLFGSSNSLKDFAEFNNITLFGKELVNEDMAATSTGRLNSIITQDR